MLFIKTLGGLALLLCGVIAGIWLCSFERKRTKQADAFLTLIRNVRLQIDCFGTPVGQILSSLDTHTREELGAPAQAQDMAELLARTQLLLPRELCRLLYEFAAALGTGYREDEIRYCEYYTARLEPLGQRLDDELEKRVRLAFLLPLSLVAMLILLLW